MLGAGEPTAGDVLLMQDAHAAHGREASSPSVTSVAGAASEFSANSWIDFLVNGRRDRHMKTACPDSVVCTAATKATLFSEPRPRLPPGRSPPR